MEKIVPLTNEGADGCDNMFLKMKNTNDKTKGKEYS